MFTIRGYYKNGRVEILEKPPSEIKEADVIILIPQPEFESSADRHFEFIDENGTSHIILNWTDTEWNSFSLSQAAKDKVTKPEDLFDV